MYLISVSHFDTYAMHIIWKHFDANIPIPFIAISNALESSTESKSS